MRSGSAHGIGGSIDGHTDRADTTQAFMVHSWQVANLAAKREEAKGQDAEIYLLVLC